MSALPARITPDLISDYVAGRLDAPEAAMVESFMNQHQAVAAAVIAARQLNSRVGLYFSRRGHQHRN